jgi:hypothetical protein
MCHDFAMTLHFLWSTDTEGHERNIFQQKVKHTLGTNPVVAYGIVLQCGHQPPLPDYHTESCSPTLQNEKVK